MGHNGPMRMMLLACAVAVMSCTEDAPAATANPHEAALKRRVDQQRETTAARVAPPIVDAGLPDAGPPAPTARLGDFLDYDIDSTPVRLQVVEVTAEGILVQVSSPGARWLKDGLVFSVRSGGTVPPSMDAPVKDEAQLSEARGRRQQGPLPSLSVRSHRG